MQFLNSLRLLRRVTVPLAREGSFKTPYLLTRLEVDRSRGSI